MEFRVSVIIAAHRQTPRLYEIVSAWLRQTADVLVADSTPNGFRTTLPAKVVRFVPDLGSRARHALAGLAEGDYIVKADDDVVPKDGLLADFVRWSRALDFGPAGTSPFLGLIGREFKGPEYYRDTAYSRADSIVEPVEVDFVGVCSFAARADAIFDVRGCSNSIEDLFWQIDRPNRKFVIPTKAYSDAPEAFGSATLFHNPAARAERSKFYRSAWERTKGKS